MEGKKYSLFLGCLVPNRYPQIEKATRDVFSSFGIPLEDIEGASCCPAPGVFKSFKKDTWLGIAERNISLAKSDIVTICSGCFGSLQDAHHDLSKAGKKPAVEVTHIVPLLKAYGLENLKKHFKRKLNLRCAAFYGCHMLKPSEIRKVDNPEKPRILDDLIEATGAKSVIYRDRLKCCGSGGGVKSAHANVAKEMAAAHIRNMTVAGVDCIVDVCPFCHMQLESVQKEIPVAKEIPVIHLSQLYALALGLDANVPKAILEKVAKGE